MVERKPFHVLSNEHFNRHVHDVDCTGRASDVGEVAGITGSTLRHPCLSGVTLHLHESMVTLPSTAVEESEKQEWQETASVSV
eukprot:682269-Hanusia_phi.AAC.1